MVNALSAKQNFPKTPKLQQGGEAVQRAAETISSAANLVVFYGNEGLGLESSHALAQASANLLVVTGHVRKVNNGLVAVWPRANDQGAWELGYKPLPDLKEAFHQYEAIYIAGADPAGDDPALAGAVREASDADTLKSISPLYKLDYVTAPLQIHYGTADGKFISGTPPEWSVKLTQGLRDADKSVELYQYEDEGHSFIGAAFSFSESFFSFLVPFSNIVRQSK